MLRTLRTPSFELKKRFITLWWWWWWWCGVGECKWKYY